MTPQILSAEHLCKTYHPGSPGEIRALADASLSIDAGSHVALVGPSGSGKTTLLSLLGAVDRPTSGAVHFGEQEFGRCSDVELARLRRRMGFVYQGFSLIPWLPVWENITYPLIPRGVTREQRRQAAKDVLGRLGLSEKFDTPPQKLSGGEQQRAAVARALVGDPEVIFADEPTSNLDRRSADELVAVLSDIHAAGTTLVISTHDRRLIDPASQVLELQDGRLVDEPERGKS